MSNQWPLKCPIFTDLLHTFTKVKTTEPNTQGDSHLVRSSQCEMPCSGTPRHSARSYMPPELHATPTTEQQKKSYCFGSLFYFFTRKTKRQIALEKEQYSRWPSWASGTRSLMMRQASNTMVEGSNCMVLTTFPTPIFSDNATMVAVLACSPVVPGVERGTMMTVRTTQTQESTMLWHNVRIVSYKYRWQGSGFGFGFGLTSVFHAHQTSLVAAKTKVLKF